jgi:hypothetical protein
LSKEKTDPIVEKLNTLIKITMASAFKDASKEERILTLLDIGIPRLEVAEIVGTKVQYVDNVKHQAKKDEAMKQRKAKGKSKDEKTET